VDNLLLAKPMGFSLAGGGEGHSGLEGARPPPLATGLDRKLAAAL